MEVCRRCAGYGSYRLPKPEVAFDESRDLNERPIQAAETELVVCKECGGVRVHPLDGERL